MNFPKSIWVIAEISELKVNRNGHCYLELVEKDVISDHIIAKSRATIWAFTFRMLRPYFEKTTGRELGPGIKILVHVSIEFHELYGLSLNITDIDPNYTLGDIALKKAEILKRLEDEGVINMNKELNLPLVPQKIAVISSETAAGYQDFINQLNNNSSRYVFYTKLFPSIMQGHQAEESIIHALEKIYHYEDFFDVVVIIRGGGSQADLGCFDSYLLAANIAQFPIPILTGIGHDKDESISDIVAHTQLKTPTAVAEFIIETTSLFDGNLNESKEQILDKVTQHLSDQNILLSQLVTILSPSVRTKIERNHYELKWIKEKLDGSIHKFCNQKQNELKILSNKLESNSTDIVHNHLEKLNSFKIQFKHSSLHFIQKKLLKYEQYKTKTNLLNPENILRRGYSLTYHQGKLLTDINHIKENDEIITKLFSGIIRSTVKGE